VLRISDEVRETLAAGGPVVALETTIVAHGFPAGEGLAVGRECEAQVRGAAAVPATVAVLDSELVVGLTERELERVAAAGPAARKAGPRELGLCIASGEIGATTVGGTLVACRHAGLRFMATGGLGGVHRGWTERPDISADLGELARTPVLIVSSGIKSLLDVPATMEVLETLGVPVLGYETGELPLFYTARGGPPVPSVDAGEAVRIARAHRQLSVSAVVVARPPVDGLDDVEPLIDEALREAELQGIHGQRVTPFVLAFLHERSGGRTLTVNRRLAADNAALAGRLARLYADSESSSLSTGISS
jgi:pseudouridine-5'-phosphate glycosidase